MIAGKCRVCGLWSADVTKCSHVLSQAAEWRERAERAEADFADAVGAAVSRAEQAESQATDLEHENERLRAALTALEHYLPVVQMDGFISQPLDRMVEMAEAHDALPEGWEVGGVEHRQAGWQAFAYRWDPTHQWRDAISTRQDNPTPAAALRSLAAKLRGSR